MNRKQMASELVKIAKSLQGAEPTPAIAKALDDIDDALWNIVVTSKNEVTDMWDKCTKDIKKAKDDQAIVECLEVFEENVLEEFQIQLDSLKKKIDIAKQEAESGENLGKEELDRQKGRGQALKDDEEAAFDRD